MASLRSLGIKTYWTFKRKLRGGTTLNYFVMHYMFPKFINESEAKNLRL